MKSMVLNREFWALVLGMSALVLMAMAQAARIIPGI